MSRVMSDLFEREPEQWGVRRDPGVWVASRSVGPVGDTHAEAEY